MSNQNHEPGFRRTAEHCALWLPVGYEEPEDDDEPADTPPAGFAGTAATLPAPGPASKPLSFEAQLHARRDLRIRDSDPRPTDPSEVIGQDDALKDARIILSSSSPSHMIFTGPPGVGKTTIARIAMQLAMSSPSCRFAPDAPFVEVDCSTLYFGRYNNMSALCSTVVEGYYSDSVRAYCAKHNLPQNSSMINLGSTARAHGGVLFLDEIGELPTELQNQLLKVLEDGREVITSSRYDPTCAAYPDWYRSFFEGGGIPAQFILIGATTRSPDELVPALRSRCTIIQFRALTFEERTQVVVQAASKYGYTVTPRAASLIASQCEGGRDSARRVQVAVSLAAARASSEIDADDVPPGSINLPGRAICVREGSHAVTFGSLVADSRRCFRCRLRIPTERKPGHCSCGRPAAHSVIIADDEHAADDVCVRCRKLIGYACVALRIDRSGSGGDTTPGVRL